MPPPQQFLASRIRGFVCRSCLLELRGPRKQRTPWLSRNIANDNGLPRSKRKDIPHLEDEPVVRYFDQTPGGIRTELRDGDDEAFVRSLSATIEDLEKRTGRRLDSLAEVSENDELVHTEDPAAFLNEISGHSVEQGTLDAITSQNELLKTQIQTLTTSSGSKNKFAENVERLRETLFKQPSNRTRAAPGNGILSIDYDTSSSAPGRGRVSTTNTSHLAPASDVKSSSVTSGTLTVKCQSDFEIPTSKFPPAYRPKIKKMNESLDRALFGYRRRKPHKPKYNNPNIRMGLWKDYLLCRSILLSMPDNIPPGLWTGLWNVFEADSVTNLDRMAHLKYVGDDMRKAGVRLDFSQRVLHIESSFIYGDHSYAIQDWELAGREGSNSTELSMEYWELGVRMFCETGQADRAMRIAETILQKTKEPATWRILIPIIKAFLNLEDGSGVQHAWNLYIRLRANLGDAIKMEDYDAVTSMFLDTDQVDLALGVFKDMMLTGHPSDPQQESIQMCRSVTGTLHDLELVKVGNKEISWEDSRTLARLPAKLNNKFFFGSWIKKLIGEGELASAKKVFDLMQERRICPSPIHMNGLIGALFRDGTEKSRGLAEDMAWKMIKMRTDFVRERDIQYKLDAPARAVGTFGMQSSKSIFLTPHATIETFTVLLQQYRRRQKFDLASDLLDALKKAHIPPNSVFMNELLWMDTRAPNKGWAWNTYLSLKDVGGVSPDFETYTILWLNMKKQVDPVIGRKPASSLSNLTTCRLLFADMVQQAPSLLKAGRLPRELYDLVILCFCYDQDQPGTAVALRALERRFNMFPSEETARSIVLQLSRLGLVNDWGEKPRRLDLTSGRSQQRVANVTKVLQMFKKQRVEALLQRGITFEELDAEARMEETLILLTDLLRYTHQARNEGKNEHEGAQKASQRAANTMGVPDCAPWEEVRDMGQPTV